MFTEGLVKSFHDISEHEETLQALEVLRAAMDSSLGAISIGDMEGRLSYVNDSFAQMWGFEDKSEVLGSPAVELWADRKRAEQDFAALWEDGTWMGENRGRRRDGKEIDVRLVANIIRDKESGAPLAWMASLEDVTQQNKAERALRLTQHAVDASIVSTALVDVEGTFTYVNDAFVRLWRYDNAGDILGKSSFELFEDQDWARGKTETLLTDGTWSGEGRGRRWDGSEFDLEIYASTVSDEETGEPIAILLTGQDVTERNKATEALRIAQTAIDTSLNAIALSDMTGKLTYVNDSYVELFGYRDASEALSQESVDFWTDPSDLEAVQNVLWQTGFYSGETIGKHRDGTQIDLQLWANVITDEKTSAPLAMMASLQDITERNRLMSELRDSEERLRVAHDLVGLGYWWFDVADGTFNAPSETKEMLGLPEEMNDMTFESIVGRYVHPEDRAGFGRKIEQLLGGRIDLLKARFRWQTSAGANLHIQIVARAERDGSGQAIRVFGVSQDISDLIATEEALNRSEMLAKAAMEGSLDAIFHMDAVRDENGRVVDLEYSFVNERGLAMLDMPHEKIIGGRLCELYPSNRPSGLFDKYVRILDAGIPFEEEWENPLEELNFQWIHHQIIPLGDTLVFHSRDISDKKKAEQQLQRAQKMEAVGQLTGGIAHDFNNLLAVISGNIEMALDELPAESNVRKMLTAGIQASERGASLTKQLLAFSRRQTLMPQPTDINQLSGHMLNLAQRTLGEAVEVVFEPADQAWWALVDPAQLENALLNLAINARDAMPEGGTLTIRTDNIDTKNLNFGQSGPLVAGDYVLVEVADTGVGMPEEIREKVFEPFFTTKDVGEGSGLGLSMVYGFAKQSGGHVDIESTLGEGTTIRLYLPRAEHARQAVPERPSPSSDASISGERVLVVEDDPHVRELAVSLVKNLGYTVLEAADVSSALEVMESGTPVDLLLSDVILGKGMNGVELADLVSEKWPHIKVLLMSGYAREAFTEQDGLGDTYDLIAKPFRMADLAQHIEVLLH